MSESDIDFEAVDAYFLEQSRKTPEPRNVSGATEIIGSSSQRRNGFVTDLRRLHDMYTPQIVNPESEDQRQDSIATYNKGVLELGWLYDLPERIYSRFYWD